MTKSDAELKRDLKHQQQMQALAVSKGQKWTAVQFETAIDETKRQLALPREKRRQYNKGPAL